MSDDLLDTEIEPAHEALAARLTLASVDGDVDRIGQGLQEVADGGLPALLAVIPLLSKHLGVSLLAAHGAERTRALLQRTILGLRVRPVMSDRATGCTGPGIAIPGADQAPATVVAYLSVTPPAGDT